MLWKRVATALVFAPALLYLVWRGGWPLGGACLLLAGLMLWEYLRMTVADGGAALHGVAYLLTAAWVAAQLGWLPGHLAGLVLPAGTMLLLMTLVLRPHPIATSMQRAGLAALGVLYAGGLIPFMARLRAVDEHSGLGLALAALFCTWAADTGAYFSGRAFGRHKLYPALSPGKTIEGAVGGTAAAIAVAFLIRAWFVPTLAPHHTVALGSLAGLFGMAGDLAESLLKRSTGTKDSSALIPGHGGVLDRFDAVIFVAPALYLYAVLALGLGAK